MKLSRLMPAVAIASIAGLVPALAGNRVFVASNGNDANACTQAAPCASFNKALTSAGANGAIVCLDRGTYTTSSFLSITTSVSILCGDGLADLGSTELTVAIAATDTVVLEGLLADRRGSIGNGIFLTQAGAVHIRNSTLRGSATNSQQTGSGVSVFTTGPTTLFITDTLIDGNSNGVFMKPFTGGYVNAHLQNVVLDRNGTGLSVDGNGSNTGINVNIAGGSIASNTTGVLVLSTGAGAPVNVSMMRTQLSGNLQTALAASASNAAGQGSGAIRIGNSQITANAQGVSPVNGGQVISLGGNQVHSNSTNGAFTSSLPTQ